MEIEEVDIETRLKRLLPEARLEWLRIPGTEIEGYLLNEESASRPLAPDRVAEVMEAPPFWSLLWPAGHLLCRWFTQFPELVKGREAVDLGCGSALVSIALEKAGAKVTACDSDDLGLLVAKLNLRKNGASLELSPIWREKTELLVLADFLYDESNLALLSEFEERSGEVLVVDSRLKELSEPNFRFLGEAQGLAVPDLDPHGEFGNIKIWYSGPREALWCKSCKDFLREG